jgi:hypothetical protein
LILQKFRFLEKFYCEAHEKMKSLKGEYDSMPDDVDTVKDGYKKAFAGTRSLPELYWKALAALLSITPDDLPSRAVARHASATKGESTPTLDTPKKEAELKVLNGRIFILSSSAINLVDMLADPMAVFMTNHPVASSPIGHRCKIEADSDKIFVTIEGRVPETITGDDLKNLTPAHYEHIKTLEQSMQEHYRQWQNIYPTRKSSPDALKKKETDEKIGQLILDMEDDLNGIITFVESLPLRLDDHYMHIRHLIGWFRQQREAKTG